MERDEVIAIIEQARLDGLNINDAYKKSEKFSQVSSYYNKTKDEDILLRLIRFDPNFINWGVIPFNTVLNPEFQIKAMMANPNVVDCLKNVYSAEGLKDLKQNWDKYSYTNLSKDIANFIDTTIEIRELEAEAEKNKEASGNSSLTVSSMEREEQRRNNSAIYADKSGAMTYGPTSSNSRRVR